MISYHFNLLNDNCNVSYSSFLLNYSPQITTITITILPVCRQNWGYELAENKSGQPNLGFVNDPVAVISTVNSVRSSPRITESCGEIYYSPLKRAHSPGNSFQWLRNIRIRSFVVGYLAGIVFEYSIRVI